ncbi:dehydrogenase [uncultured archaeon]|nr:dehydrogenase [uncultured archaeon]
MSEFDAIVVGGGPAGASAAIKLAQNNMNVLLVERGDPPGSKNVSGGVLWGTGLGELSDDWEKTAPLERYLESKSVAFLTEKSKINIDFSTKNFEEQKTGYTVLRAKLDPWLVKKAREAGAMVVTGVTVDRLSKKDGKVVGVIQDGDEITADAVILAEGANPRVAIDSGLREPLKDHDVAIGVKEVIKLPEKTINERFNLRGKAGYACEYVLGFLKDGVEAGGFLYTNKDSISIGAVISMKHLRQSNQVYSFDIMEEFASHPFIAPLLEEGRVDEYSAHLVQEGGLSSIPKLYGDGYMIAGDAAGFSFSNGLVLQGMNYAISSGISAAEALVEAKQKSDFSSASLSRYQQKLEESYVMKDMRTFKGIENVTWSKMIHKTFPSMLENVMMGLFKEEGKPKKHMMQLVLDSMSSSKIKSKDMLLQGYRMLRRM